MNDPLYQELLAASWRRKLTVEEEARLHEWLAAHPEAQASWEEEAALNRQLQQLPEAPLSSNFTARVLLAVDADARRASAARPAAGWATGWLRGWLPKFASAALVLAMGVAGFYQYQAINRTRLVESVKIADHSWAALGPEVFRDFEAIQQLRYVPAYSDDELLAVLEK